MRLTHPSVHLPVAQTVPQMETSFRCVLFCTARSQAAHGIPHTLTHAELRAAFRRLGGFISVTIIRRPRGLPRRDKAGNSLMFAHAEFSSRVCAAHAMANLNGAPFRLEWCRRNAAGGNSRSDDSCDGGVSPTAKVESR